MMGLHVYREFLVDLRNFGDSTLARRVLAKVLDSGGRFVADREDHPYRGIPNAWIRYVSRGSGPAYRVIYIKDREDIYLYRAGPHSVEDSLSVPSQGRPPINVSTAPAAMEEAIANEQIVLRENQVHAGTDRFLKNYTPELMRNRILGRRLIIHSEVILISPFLSEDLFEIRSPFAKVLSDMQDEGAKICLITLPPSNPSQMKFFEHIDAEGISVLFHDRLHAKLFLFDVNHTAFESPEEARRHRLAIVGSANLTKEGLGIPGADGSPAIPNEELSYELPYEEFDRALEFATYLTLSARDLVSQRVLLAQARRSHH